MIFPNRVILSSFSVENHPDMKTCKGSCHLESKMPKQMPVKFLRYIIKFTRYEGCIFPPKDVVLKIKAMCLLEHKTPEQMPFKMWRYIIKFWRYEGKLEMALVCTAAILNFPAKQYIVLKIKEMCHIEHKTSEQRCFPLPVWTKWRSPRRIS